MAHSAERRAPDARRRVVLGATADVLGMYAEGAGDIQRAQAAVDRTADAAVQAAPALFAGLLTPIERLVNAAENLEAARDGLAGLYLDRTARAPLAGHLATALQAADAIGAATVRTEFADASAGTPFISAGDFFRARGFTIAGVGNADLLGAVKTELVKALDEGTTLQDFQRAMPALFDRYGVTALAPHRIDTIYRTNVQSAFGAARYRELTDPAVQGGFPYWRYVAILDSHTRPSHRALHGKIWRQDDPIWRRIYPPWDFNCRCAVQPVSAAELRERGWAVEGGPPDGDLSTGFGPRGSSLADLLARADARRELEQAVWTEAQGQPGPAELGRPAERDLPATAWRPAPDRVPSLEERMQAGGLGWMGAVNQVEAEFKQAMGIAPREVAGVLAGPDGELMTVDLNSLAHAMLKRPEARERYLEYFRQVIESPFEILLTEYQTETGAAKFRKKYLGLFQAANREAVIITAEASPDGWTMWNVFPSRRGTIDRQRRGLEVLYGQEG